MGISCEERLDQVKDKKQQMLVYKKTKQRVEVPQRARRQIWRTRRGVDSGLDPSSDGILYSCTSVVEERQSKLFLQDARMNEKRP